MLPPGIFVWKTGDSHIASPTDPAGLAGAHPSWESALAPFDPWSDFTAEAGMTFAQGAGSEVVAPVVAANRCATSMASARALAEQGVIGEWGSFICAEQSSGRGQLRRPWVSSPGNLHASLVMPAVPVSGEWSNVLADLLPLVVGQVFSTVLEELGADVRIKWPNDLLQNGRKVGGMLVEEKKGLVILGIGLNLIACPSDDSMREDCSVSAGILQIPGNPGSALALWQTLVNRGKDVYTVLLDELEPSQFLSGLESRLAWFGQRVRVREGDRDEYHAVIVGLSPGGGLVLAHGERKPSFAPVRFFHSKIEKLQLYSF